MEPSNTLIPVTRHDGWTAERRAQFLDRLAQDGNVLAACAHVGLSREAAYRLRRREPLFARAWAAAQALAREATAQALGTRAIDGIEEQVWYRGEVVGTRRRYDNRLLLAHMARLDRLAEANPRAEADADRFDELVARAAGLALPEALNSAGADLPLPREAHLEKAERDAEQIARWMHEDAEGEREDADGSPPAEEDAAALAALKSEIVTACWNARIEAAVAWDAWVGDAVATVDRLLAQPSGGSAFDVETLSPLSTSRPADAAPDEPRQPTER